MTGPVLFWMRVPDSTSKNCLTALSIRALQYRKLKPRHPNSVLFFRLGVFYQTFGEDAELLGQIAGVPLRFAIEELPIAEIPVLDCETAIERITQRGYGIIILDEGLP
jgi:DNA mismatch repair protein MutS